jgi:broad specificity phosphatase PhoE
MTRLVLCRHGEAKEAQGRFCGALDVSLSAAGHRQAKALATALPSLDAVAVYTSPARRAVDTSGPIAAQLGVAPIVEPDFCELDFGEAEGLRFEEAAARWPTLYEEWLQAPTRVCFPGGEEFAGFRARVLAAAACAVERHAGAAVAVVTHAGVIRTLLAYWLAMPDEALFRIDQAHGSVNVVDWQDGTPLVRLVNGSPTSLAGAHEPSLLDESRQQAAVAQKACASSRVSSARSGVSRQSRER